MRRCASPCLKIGSSAVNASGGWRGRGYTSSPSEPRRFVHSVMELSRHRGRRLLPPRPSMMTGGTRGTTRVAGGRSGSTKSHPLPGWLQALVGVLGLMCLPRGHGESRGMTGLPVQAMESPRDSEPPSRMLEGWGATLPMQKGQAALGSAPRWVQLHHQSPPGAVWCSEPSLEPLQGADPTTSPTSTACFAIAGARTETRLEESEGLVQLYQSIWPTSSGPKSISRRSTAESETNRSWPDRAKMEAVVAVAGRTRDPRAAPLPYPARGLPHLGSLRYLVHKASGATSDMVSPDVGDKTILTQHSDTRQRDLLPLPNFWSGNFTRGQAVFRVVRRRALRQQHTLDCACAGFVAFSFLGGCADALALSSHPLAPQIACVYTFDAYSRVGPPPPDCTPEGALRELLGSSRVYHSDRSDIQSYDRHLVSWPVAGSRPVPLLDALPAATRLGLNDWETHLLDSAENATLKRAELVAGQPYYDPERFRTIQSYGTFVGELADRGMLRFRLRDPADPDAAFDILFVRRKKGTLRLIFDTRYFYFGFRASLSTVLPAASSLDSIEVMRDDTGFTMYADFSKCCHGLDVPNSLGQRFTIPSLLARFCGVSTINGAAIPPFAFVEPYVITLPIGCNGGLHPCQMCVSPVVERYVVLDHIVFDRHPGVSISGGQHAGAASFGGLCVICTSRDVADTLLVDIVADSTEIGLCVHDIVQASEHATSVGLELEHNRLSLESSRLCRPRLSIDDIVGRRHCSGARFDVVLGHVTCTPILRHEGLAVLDKVHQYLRDVGDAIGVLRHDAVTGFLQLSRPLPPSTAQISAPCSSQVHCSYASPFGLEVCSRVLPLDVVRDIWRSSEKWTLTALTTCAFTLGIFALTRPPRAKAARMLFSDRTLTLLILLTVMLLSSATAAHSISTPPTISSPTRAAGLHFRHPVLLLHRHGDLPGETGLCDEAISLEQSDGFEGVLLAPTTRRPPKQRLWKATGSMSHQAFVETIDLLHVTALKPTPYRLRRGGASEDLGGRKRSLAELTRRSRCASDMSLTSYTKINQPDVRTREFGPQGLQVRAGNSAGHLGVPLRGEAPSSSSPRALPRPGP